MAALDGEVKNAQHGFPVVDPDMMEEREASPVVEAFVLATFCGGGVNCCFSSHCCRLLRRGVASRRRWGRGLFLVPPPDLRSGGGDCEAEKTNDGVTMPAGGTVSLAAAEAGDPM